MSLAGQGRAGFFDALSKDVLRVSVGTAVRQQGIQGGLIVQSESRSQ
jgi:hypothetical protein